MTILSLSMLLFQTQNFVHEPTTSYARMMISGFQVMVSSAARSHPETTRPALDMLKEKLAQVNSIVPKLSLPLLHSVKIWVEENNPDFPSMCYHTSKDWLAEHGYNVDKEHGVEVANATNYVAWTKLNQPFQVFHELAHAYHDLTFGFQDPYIEACYQSAVKSRKYDLVDHHPHGKRRHYALTNQQEYFAELSESYFGKNDFYPFDRGELRTFDQKGFEMIERCWRTRQIE